MRSLDPLAVSAEPPPLLTIEEAARVLRIGRSRAYALAREYMCSGGTAGMPVIRLGPSCLRVPRWALIELATTGRVVRLRARLDDAVTSGPPVAVDPRA